VGVKTVGVHEAKTNLSKLLRRVAAGEEVTIERSGKPIARLVPIRETAERRLGKDEGLFEVPDDFDEALPDEFIDAFYR
jgi:prevent-host-death family protein